MRYEQKNKKGLFIIIVGVIAIVIIARALGFGSVNNATRIGYAGNSTSRVWNGTYLSLDGTMQRTMNAKEDFIHLDVTTKSGTIAITIVDTKGNEIFSRQDIGSGSFDLEVSGRVIVTIVANRHEGSFNITTQR